MSCAQPLWFWGLLLLPVLGALQVVRERRRRALLTKLVASRLQEQLAGTVSSTKRWLRFTLLLLGLAFVFLTLAQPRWGEEVTVQQIRGRDVLLVIDTSRSMLANDLQPTRLARVKLAAADLIGQLRGDRVGLVAFAGSAFLQAPLTGDTSAVLSSLQELDTDIIPLGGTDIAEALHIAMDAFGKSESEDRAIVLFTDGEDLDAEGIKVAKEIRGKVRIFTVGAGSPDGTVIALPSRRGQMEYLKDPDGQIVKSKLDETTLRAIAEAGGGFYTHLRAGPAEMQQIYRDGLMRLAAHSADSQFLRRPLERFQWPLSAALLFLISSLFIGERRRRSVVAPAATMLALLLLSMHSHATNEGLQKYGEGDYAGAAEHFERELQKRPGHAAMQYDLGTAAYKAGQLEKAVESFSQAIRAKDSSLRQKAEYNLANTLFQRGSLQKERPPKVQDWQNAIQHYDEALRVNPRDANAVYNRDVVKKLLEQEKEEQKKEEQQKKDEEKKEGDKNEEEKDEQGEGKDKKEGDKQEGKDRKDQQGKSGDSKGKDGDQGQKQEGKDGKGDPKNQKGKETPEQKAAREQQQQEQEGKDGKPAKPRPQGDIKGTEKGEAEQRAREAEEKQAREAAADQSAAEAGQMTEAQARSLLDSMRNEDVRVRLLNPGQKRKPNDPQMLRDW